MNQTTQDTHAGKYAADELADIAAIRRLTHDYAWAVDHAQLDDLIPLFTEDAEWDTTAFGMGIERGQEALRAFFQGLIDNTKTRCHMAMNHRIELNGDEATATVYLHAFVEMAQDGRRDESVGYYADDYVRTPQGWKFRRRVANPLMDPPEAPV